MTAPELAGVIHDLEEAAYHASPALSSSGAKKILDCPAKYRHDRDHGQAPRQVFDVGHAFHKGVLGVGGEIVVVQKVAKDGTKSDAGDYNTKSAQEHRDEIRDEGKIPLLRKEANAVEAMTAAVRAHPEAGPLFDPANGGLPEVSVFWDDQTHGIPRRARFDWLNVSDSGKAVVGDLKSTASARPDAFAKSVFSFGYDIQRVFYEDAIVDGGLAEKVDDFLFVAVEKEPPYVVQVFRLDLSWLELGRRRVDKALRTYAECVEWDSWPGYSTDALTISAPAWALREAS